MNDKYITVLEYAAIKGISKQAVYKKLTNQLKEFVVVVDGKNLISVAVLSPDELTKLSNIRQPKSQPTDNQKVNPENDFFKTQIAEKDKQISQLLKQIESLQEQNSKLTDLLNNNQVLLAAEKKEKQLLLDIPKEEKNSIFNIFKRRKKKVENKNDM